MITDYDNACRTGFKIEPCAQILRQKYWDFHEKIRIVLWLWSGFNFRVYYFEPVTKKTIFESMLARMLVMLSSIYGARQFVFLGYNASISYTQSVRSSVSRPTAYGTKVWYDQMCQDTRDKLDIGMQPALPTTDWARNPQTKAKLRYLIEGFLVNSKMGYLETRLWFRPFLFPSLLHEITYLLWDICYMSGLIECNI